MNTKIFAQSELLADIAVLEVPTVATAAEVRDACLSLLAPDIDKSAIALYLEDDDDEQSLGKLEKLPKILHVHLHRLKAIDVTVRYAGRDVRRTFRPSATIARIKTWATKELGITASDAAELMLQITGTDKRPDADVHVGALVKAPAKAISFDLVPSPRVNG